MGILTGREPIKEIQNKTDTYKKIDIKLPMFNMKFNQTYRYQHMLQNM